MTTAVKDIQSCLNERKVRQATHSYAGSKDRRSGGGAMSRRMEAWCQVRWRSLARR